MRWAFSLVLMCAVGAPSKVHAEGWIDLLASSDQQGRYAYERGNVEVAAQKFVDPFWRGRALYELGKYKEAAEAFAAQDTAASNHNRGLALLKAREHQMALEAFERASKIDPEDKEIEQLKKDLLEDS